MKKIILLFLLSTSFLFGNEVVYAWGYGDILGETLQMVALLFHYEDYTSAWKIMLALALFSAAMSSVIPNSDIWKAPKVFLVSTLVWSMFVVSQITIEVEDVMNSANNKTINNVPWAVGYPMALISSLDYKLGTAYELASSMPASLRYSDNGMMLPLSLFNSSVTYKITDPRLSQNVFTYITECALPDFEDGTKNYDFVLNTDDLWAYMGGTNPAIMTKYLKADGTTEIKSCSDDYGAINSDMNAYFSASGGAMQNLATQMGFASASAIATKLGSTHQWLHGATSNASNILMQNASINAFSGAFKSYAAMNSADPSATAMYAGKAESVASSNMVISGILGSKYIPITKGILVCIVAGLTPMLALVMLTPIGAKSFLGYLTMLLWLATWHLGEVILNHLVSVKAKGVIDMYADDKLTVTLKPLVEAASMDYINMISSMYWMVPTISGLIVGGFSWGALASMTGGITGRVAKGEAVGSEMGMGSWQSGNVRMNTTMANKHDTTSMLGYGQAHNIQGAGIQSTNMGTQLGISNTGVQQMVSGQMQNIADTLNKSGGHNLKNGVGTSFSGTGEKTYNDNGYIMKAPLTNTGADGSVTTINPNGSNMQFDKDGNILNAQNIKYSSVGKDGKSVDGEFSYSNGKLTYSSIKNDSGTKIDTSYNSDGTALQTITTQNGSTTTRKIDADGKDIGSAIDMKMSQGGTAVKYAKNKTIEAATSGSVVEAFAKASGVTNTTGNETAIGNGSKWSNANSNQNAETIRGQFGAGINKVVKLGAEFQKSITDTDTITTDKNGNLTVTDKNGKTTTWDTKDEYKKQFQKAWQEKEAEMAGKDFNTNKAMRDLWDAERKRGGPNETAVQTLERINNNIDDFEKRQLESVSKSNPEILKGSELGKTVESNINNIDGATKTEEQIDAKKNREEAMSKFEKAKADYMSNYNAANKEANDGVRDDAAKALLGLAVGAGLVMAGKKGYDALKKTIDSKMSKSTDFEKSANEIEKNIKKMDDALDGKDTKNARQAFADMGMLKHAEQNGLVFKGNDLDVEATKSKQAGLKAEGKLKDFVMNPSASSQASHATPTPDVPKSPSVGNTIVKNSGVSADVQAKNNAGWNKLVSSGTQLKDLPVNLSDRGNYGRLTGKFDAAGNPEVAFFKKGETGTTKSMPWSVIAPAVDNPQAHSLFNSVSAEKGYKPTTPTPETHSTGGGFVKNVAMMFGAGYVANELDKKFETNMFSNGLNATDLANPLGILSGTTMGNGELNHHQPRGTYNITPNYDPNQKMQSLNMAIDNVFGSKK